MFCQLEMLRNSLPQNVRQILQDLPTSLDETYERMLREILKANPDQAYRLLQCLTVATRPLHVDELAEILALDFDGGEDEIPVLNRDWRWDNEQQGVLATCSSLVVVVDSYDFTLGMKTRVVQFAHFSVKEFLTSDRLVEIKTNISRFHIRLDPAHTTIAQSCLAILLQSDHDDRAKTTSALSTYAARNWVHHAHFGNVSLRIKCGMRRLFDPAKSYFTAWLNSSNLVDITWTSFLRDYSGRPLSSHLISSPLGEDHAPLCLYCAALCGFCDVTGYLITKYPRHVDAMTDVHKSPLVAALHNRHFRVAELLHQHGATLPIGYDCRTLLHAASADGLVDVAQWLLDIGADASAQERNHRTPLHLAVANGRLEIVRILLGHGADVNGVAATHQSTYNNTPLHEACSGVHIDIVRLLIEHGADVHARDQSQSTPLHLAVFKRNADIARLLIEGGADVDARDRSQSTPLHLTLFNGNADIARLLIEHGADVDARDRSQSTLLHLAVLSGCADMVRLLSEHGADVHARDQSLSTPLHLASSMWTVETVQLLIEHGADVNARDQRQSTPLHLALFEWCFEIARLLIKRGADVDARDQSQSTPLHLALDKRNTDMARLLIEHGADVHARDQSQSTPLHLALFNGNADMARLLIEHGADVHARDQSQSTPLHLALFEGNADIVRLLIEHGADVHARNQDQSTPLHLASSSPFWMNIGTTVRLLIEHGASVNAYDKNHQTPLHRLSSCLAPNADSLRLLLENGADVDAENDKGFTPFQIALSNQNLSIAHHKIAQFLLVHRTNILSK